MFDVSVIVSNNSRFRFNTFDDSDFVFLSYLYYDIIFVIGGAEIGKALG